MKPGNRRRNRLINDLIEDMRTSDTKSFQQSVAERIDRLTRIFRAKKLKSEFSDDSKPC